MTDSTLPAPDPSASSVSASSARPTPPSSGTGLSPKVRATVESSIDRDDLFRQLSDAVAFPSVHGAEPEACRAAAEWTRDRFAEVGIDNLEIVECSDGSFAVCGLTEPAPGRPTILLYCHHDVQPADDQEGWTSSPWKLVERGGRWVGRGAADCKGNLVMHLAALRALRAVVAEHPDSVSHTAHPFGGIGVRLIVEGSEEQGGEGLDNLLATEPERFAADSIVIADTGNVAVGVPTVTTSLRGVCNLHVTVETLRSPVHSGMFGGAAPDALQALISLIASLRGPDGGTTIDDVPADQSWDGVAYPEETFRSDAGVLEGVDLGSAGSVAEMTWARPTVTTVALDAPRTDAPVNAVPATASAVLNLRVPPGMDPDRTSDLLMAHLERRVPQSARLSIEREASGQPYSANTTGTLHRDVTTALAEAYGKECVTTGEGGSIPLCPALKKAVPGAEITLYGVEEPACGIHGPDESVDPSEIERVALTETLLLLTHGR